MKIPKVIHQVFEDVAGPSEALKEISKSWQRYNPEWQYMFWGKVEIELLLGDFPELIDEYKAFPYNVQRWDIVRLLILYQYGGLYVDIDYECFRSLDSLFDDNKSCYIGLEPYEHAKNNEMKKIVGNAFIASVPKNDFIHTAIKNIFNQDFLPDIHFSRGHYIVNSTGPFFLTRMYNSYADQESISLISPSLVTPLTIEEARLYNKGKSNEEIIEKLKKSYAAHYFIGGWWSKDEIIDRITNSLIINSITIDIGLANGVLGVIIFIYELSRATRNKILEEFADKLVDKVFKGYNALPYTFSDGAVGVGCGIQYLINKGYLEANEDVFDDFDEAIFQLDRKKFKFHTSYWDYYGPGMYYLSRSSKNDKRWRNKALNFIKGDITNAISRADSIMSGKYLLSLAFLVTYAPELPKNLKTMIDVFISCRLGTFANSELLILKFLADNSSDLKTTQNKLIIPEGIDFLAIVKITQVLGVIAEDVKKVFSSEISSEIKSTFFNSGLLGLAGISGYGMALIQSDEV